MSRNRDGEPAVAEIQREARRVLCHLVGGGARLRPIASPGREAAEWGLFPNDDPRASPELKTTARFVDAFIRNDWVVAEAGGVVLSAAGVAWLRRAEAAADGYRAQHQVRRRRVVGDGAGSRVVTVNAAESPLGWMRSRRDGSGRPLLGEEQFCAGERLRRDFELAGLQPRLTADWQRPLDPAARRSGRNTRDEPGLTAIAARKRLETALAAVGPELAGILLEVCCFQSGLEAAEATLGWPRRSAKIVLQLALTRLARHYGLMARPESPAGQRLRHWGAAGYRPTI